jgi:hypothetical protein
MHPQCNVVVFKSCRISKLLYLLKLFAELFFSFFLSFFFFFLFVLSRRFLESLWLEGKDNRKELNNVLLGLT